MNRIFPGVLCSLLLCWGPFASTAAAQGVGGVDVLAVVYERLDEQLALGQGRVGARARPAPKPDVPESDEEDGRFVPRSRQAYRNELDERFRRNNEAQQAQQTARLEAFSRKVTEQCGSGPIGPAAVGMTVQRFEQCSPEIRFGGGLTHVISLVVQGLAGKLYVFDGDRVHKVYAVDGHITRIDPPALHAVQPSVLSLGTYPHLVRDPYVVALSQGQVFALGPAYGEDWSAPAGADLKAWGRKRERIHTSVPTPPFMGDVREQAWMRFAPPPACAGLWHQHTLTVLPDDRVLVAGGLCDISRAANEMGTFEPQVRTALWDARQRTWLEAPSLRQPRIHHTASLLDGQKVMLVGGFDDPLTTDEQEAPRAPTQADAPAPPHVRALRSVELFNAGRFDALAPLGTARAKHTATVLPSGVVLVVGGMGDDTKAMAQVEAWDPVALHWVARAPLRTARYGHAATLLADGRVLVTGGIDANEAMLHTTEIYNPATDTWSDGPPLPEHLQGHATMVLPDGRVLLAGGMAFPVEQRTPWLHIWRPAEPSWQALGICGAGPHGASRHRPALVALDRDRVLIFSGLGVWLFRTTEAAGAPTGAAASDTLPHFTDTWWVPPAPTPAPAKPPAPKPGQPGLWARVGQGLWESRDNLLVLVAVLIGLWLVGKRWARMRQAVNSVAQPGSVLRKPVARTAVRIMRLLVRVLIYGALLVLAAPHVLAYLGLQMNDMDDLCHVRPAACLNADTGLLARQWRVPGRSKFSAPRVPCTFVGEWRITLRSQEFTLTMQADGTYQMKSPTFAERDDAGYWAVQGRYILWRSTKRQASEIDINQIVSNDGSRFELIESDGVHTHFERRGDLERGRCQP